MSKRVLKLAGQRPMLLAVIMATLTLGLLFSGWLTPTPGRAQGNSGPNPPPNIENTNCPAYVTNAPSTNCPSITNNGAIGPTSFCLDYHGNVPQPQLTNQPGASPGDLTTSVTETCSNITTSSTSTITYGFSGLKYRNGNGPPTQNSPPGDYWADCYVTVSSSDTNHCAPSPSEIDFGNVTWHINNGIDAGSYQGTANNGGQTWSPDWKTGINDLVNGTGVNISVRF